MGSRTDPKQAFAGHPAFAGKEGDELERSLHAVRDGGDIKAQFLLFPKSRPCNDIAFLLAFLVVFFAVTGFAVYGVITYENPAEYKPDNRTQKIDMTKVILAAFFGGVVLSWLTGMLFTLMARCCPGCMVWTALIFTPALNIGLGGLCIWMKLWAPGIIAFVFALIFVIWILCICKFIPFTIEVLGMLGQCLSQHTSMFTIPFIGGFGGVLWNAGVLICFYLFQVHVIKSNDNKALGYVVYFVYALIFYWGSGVFYNVCHCVYAGVFGRWYWSMEKESPLCRSIKVALGSSLGSICFGSLIVAVIRAMEAVANAAKNDAAGSGNVACWILACVVECIIGCIGDIIEYFNEWAYIQCALRGCGYVNSVKITFSLMTMANMRYILSDLILDTVVTLGCFACVLVGTGAGAGIGYFLAPKEFKNMDGSEKHIPLIFGIVCGFVGSFVVGPQTVGIITSGAKTLLVCFAEHGEPMKLMMPGFARKLDSKVYQATAPSGGAEMASSPMLRR